MTALLLSKDQLFKDVTFSDCLGPKLKMCSGIRFSKISWVTGKRLDPEEKGLNYNK